MKGQIQPRMKEKRTEIQNEKKKMSNRKKKKTEKILTHTQPKPYINRWNTISKVSL